MNNKEFGKQFEKRTKDFAIDIIKLSGILPQTAEGKVIKNQITKSALVLEPIIEKQTDQEVKLILGIK